MCSMIILKRSLRDHLLNTAGRLPLTSLHRCLIPIHLRLLSSKPTALFVPQLPPYLRQHRTSHPLFTPSYLSMRPRCHHRYHRSCNLLTHWHRRVMSSLSKRQLLHYRAHLRWVYSRQNHFVRVHQLTLKRRTVPTPWVMFFSLSGRLFSTIEKENRCWLFIYTLYACQAQRQENELLLENSLSPRITWTEAAWLLFCVVQNMPHSSPIEAFRKMLDSSNSLGKSMNNEVVEYVWLITTGDNHQRFFLSISTYIYITARLLLDQRYKMFHWLLVCPCTGRFALMIDDVFLSTIFGFSLCDALYANRVFITNWIYLCVFSLSLLIRIHL